MAPQTFQPKIIRAVSCSSCAAKATNAHGQMECRFNPPTATAIVGPDPRGNPTHIATVCVFPIVNADMSCRQYKRAALDESLAGMAIEGAA